MKVNENDLKSYRAHILAGKLGVDLDTARKYKEAGVMVIESATLVAVSIVTDPPPGSEFKEEKE